MRACLLITCGKPLVQREGERGDRFRRRKFCPGHVCANLHLHYKHRAELPQEKTCVGCGVVFTWPIGMPPAQWERQRYHSQPCSATAPLGGRKSTPRKPAARRRSRPKAKPVSLVHPRRRACKPVPPWRPAGLPAWPNAWAGHRRLVNLTKESTWQCAS